MLNKDKLALISEKAEMAYYYAKQGREEEARKKIKQVAQISVEIANERGVEPGDR